ncbi:bifunctional non-homologous end joining protein LigD [Rhizobium azooxidifex]|uniref:DNA ligase (ATP) n=1 Tax=Mycoplana azooxidifex TaxID=1636188 RepID=A0A7W6D215_9HYPH|nr:DNA ligase D [Mycoplana azooxidifex]MBB3975276.1 bifunctional non-homologous end joining protein LigD [Mycoplana azooxidifex]
MALETYRRKRNFEKTSEPRGGKAKAGGASFVIQKHDARRLHYDFRLEMDGALKSWAVTRGPSLVPGEKRLAVHVEDHPLEYGDFEGTIPKGEYGGGTVIVWDRGTWEPLEDPHKGYAKGHLEFELHGEKLHGHWHLVRMEGKPGERRENWLLIKGEDDDARDEGAPDILEERPESVKTGRVIADVTGEEPGWSSKTGRITKKAARKTKTAPPDMDDAAPAAVTPGDPAKIEGARKARLPAFVEPSLATLATRPPAGARWLHEIKFDGYRLQARIEAGKAKLLTRSGLDWTDRFGKQVLAAFRDLPVGNALFDGELVVEGGSGASDFSALQADLSEGRTDRFVYYAFDLLHLDGYDLTGATLVRRKALLHTIIPSETGILRYSTDFEDDGEVLLTHACRLGLEGIVSKVADDPYRSGRSKGWLKAKCALSQEFVVAGWVPSSTARKAVGSLVLGVYDGDRLEHVGRVGTGFSHALAIDLAKRLERLKAEASPFAQPLTAVEARGARFVRPELVAEVEFRAWTADGHLRHASFRGIREDKQPKDIIRETASTATGAGGRNRNGSKESTMSKSTARPNSSVELTHPDRVYWPKEGVTKGGLADYYAEVWPFMEPFVVDRPLALLRCPDGIDGQQFFQKHPWKGINAHITLVTDPKEPAEAPCIAIGDFDGLTGLVQSAALEIHPWGSTTAAWEKPDTIIMDLDPGPGVAWSDVIAAAEEIRDRMKDLGLATFVKTSGGKGLHVVSPLKPSAEWPDAKAFTKDLADRMAADSPDKYVSTIAKAKRGGKILIDYLRNQRGQTAVAPYSTRARPGAPVSMPLAWDELDASLGPAHFTVLNAGKRLAALPSDPWADFRKSAAPLPGAGARKGRAA